MSLKKVSRLRRARKTRFRIRDLGEFRLSINRTCRHMYAQVITSAGDRVVAAASTLELSVEGQTSNKLAAEAVGKLIAERAQAAGVSKVAFDRSGFRYHGRVQALADAARAGGLQF